VTTPTATSYGEQRTRGKLHRAKTTRPPPARGAWTSTKKMSCGGRPTWWP